MDLAKGELIVGIVRLPEERVLRITTGSCPFAWFYRAIDAAIDIFYLFMMSFCFSLSVAGMMRVLR
jgi:hypothetical protein